MIKRAAPEHLLAGVAVILPSLAFIAPLGAAPTLALLSLALLLSGPFPSRAAIKTLLPLAALLAALGLWGALSLRWSVIPGHSLFEAARFLVISASGLIVTAAALALPEGGRARVGTASMLGLALSLIIVVIEVAGDLPVHRVLSERPALYAALDRGAVVASIACWPVIIHLVGQRRILAAVIAWASTLGALLSLSSLAALLGLLAGAAAFAVALRWPRAVGLLLLGGFAAVEVFLPMWRPSRDLLLWLHATAPWLRPSALHRLAIWRFTGDRIAEHPLLGWGLDAARAMPGGKTDLKTYLILSPDFPLVGEVMPLHPHDAILQLWLELGFVGAFLGAAVFTFVVWRAVPRTPTRAAHAGFIAIIAATLPPLLISFSVWQAWWQSTLWLVTALTLAASGAQPAQRGTTSSALLEKLGNPGGRADPLDYELRSNSHRDHRNQDHELK